MPIDVASITSAARAGSTARRTVGITLLTLLLALSGAQAQDEDGVLDTPSLEGIPERMQELEREWADDVGLELPVDEPPDEHGAEAAPPSTVEHHDEPEPVKAAPADEPKREPSTIRKPVPGETREPVRKPSQDAGKDALPSRAERRATAEE